jgi:hypothetical protein
METRQTDENVQADASYGGLHREPERTAWVGWIMFAGVIMVMLGTFQAIAGLVALFNDEYYLVTRSNLVVSVDYTAWGWVHLLLGIVIAGAGLGVMVGQMWARVVGILVALVSAVVNLAFLAANPVWCTIMITLDVLVIWALTVHGKETKADYV